MKTHIRLIWMICTGVGCSGTSTPPVVGSRETTYDMLALPPMGRLPAVAIVGTADTFVLELDGITVTGLDQAVKTWATVVRGANVGLIRHTVTQSDTSSADRLADSGRVVLTLRDGPAKPPRDTTMIFVATWTREGRQWLLQSERIRSR